MSSVFVSMLQIRRKRDFNKLSLGTLRYVTASKSIEYMTKEELKEIFDTIFLLEFERIPLIINDLPEIARWRLSIVK